MAFQVSQIAVNSSTAIQISLPEGQKTVILRNGDKARVYIGHNSDICTSTSGFVLDIHGQVTITLTGVDQLWAKCGSDYGLQAILTVLVY